MKEKEKKEKQNLPFQDFILITGGIDTLQKESIPENLKDKHTQFFQDFITIKMDQESQNERMDSEKLLYMEDSPEKGDLEDGLKKEDGNQLNIDDILHDHQNQELKRLSCRDEISKEVLEEFFGDFTSSLKEGHTEKENQTHLNDPDVLDGKTENIHPKEHTDSKTAEKTQIMGNVQPSLRGLLNHSLEKSEDSQEEIKKDLIQQEIEAHEIFQYEKNLPTNREKENYANLKCISNKDLKDLFLYLDCLFGNLPESVIIDFAKSPFYKKYNKVLDELDL